MAKLLFTAAAFLLLFAFSHAFTSSDLPNGLDATTDNNIPVTDAADVKVTTETYTLRLPSERSGPGSETVVELVPETNSNEKNLPESEFVTIESNEENTADASKSSETMPLTVISFRPVGRHFPRRPFPLSFRHGHRCRHGHRQAKWTPRVRGGRDLEKDATPYGDDMILSAGEELKFDRPFRGGPRQIPVRWGNFRHVGPRSPFKHDDEMDPERPHSHHRRHRHHHHDHDFEMENEGEEHHHHEHGHGLLRTFRKFLRF